MHYTVESGAQQGLYGKVTAHFVRSDLDRSRTYAYYGRYELGAVLMPRTASTPRSSKSLTMSS
jgi:hypothetical protein